MIIKIKDHDIKLGFGLYFLGKAQEARGTDLDGLLSYLIKNPISNPVDLMWLSAECEAELDEIELPIKKREFVNYLEETKDFDKTDGVLAKWMSKFTNTIKGNFLPKEENEDEDNSDVKKK